MKIYKVFIPRSSCHVIDIQKWLKENNMQHEPTEKNQDGWVFSLLNESDAVALKLRWR